MNEPLTTPIPDGQLANNILYFARALREAGLPVGPGAVLDALAAVEAAGGREKHARIFQRVIEVIGRKHSGQTLTSSARRQYRGAAPRSGTKMARGGSILI